MQKMRVRNHQVVLNRSVGGDAGIFTFLIIMGAFMFLPMIYVVMQSLKPLDELWMFPPKFYVVHPTLKNFSDLFTLLSDSWVPFSRYIFNTVFITAAGTFGNLLFSSLAAVINTVLNMYLENGTQESLSSVNRSEKFFRVGCTT